MEFREDYGIPLGQAMHFADIKHLLDPKSAHNETWENIFSNSNEELDYEKLYHFYQDLLSLIHDLPFIIQVTGYRWNPSHHIRSVSKNYRKQHIYYHPYIAFREHLNLMSYYLLDLHHIEKKRRKKITKLRYDGDIGLGERDDIKEAYHHSITLGTKHFRPQTVTELFDEIRFIGKNEVAQNATITHAGCEIVDFVTTICARDLWQVETEKILLKFPDSKVIDPLPTIRSKILHSQKIDDVYFEENT
jgi:hypothetical protein